MRVHHLVSVDNVRMDGSIIDPRRVRHGALSAGRVAALAAPVDPRTHLNRDFPDHQANVCVVVAALRVGAPVLFEGDGFRLAWVRPDGHTRLGPVAVGERRVELRARFAAGAPAAKRPREAS